MIFCPFIVMLIAWWMVLPHKDFFKIFGGMAGVMLWIFVAVYLTRKDDK